MRGDEVGRGGLINQLHNKGGGLREEKTHKLVVCLDLVLLDALGGVELESIKPAETALKMTVEVAATQVSIDGLLQFGLGGDFKLHCDVSHELERDDVVGAGGGVVRGGLHFSVYGGKSVECEFVEKMHVFLFLGVFMFILFLFLVDALRCLSKSAQAFCFSFSFLISLLVNLSSFSSSRHWQPRGKKRQDHALAKLHSTAGGASSTSALQRHPVAFLDLLLPRSPARHMQL